MQPRTIAVRVEKLGEGTLTRTGPNGIALKLGHNESFHECPRDALDDFLRKGDVKLTIQLHGSMRQIRSFIRGN